MRKFCLRLAPPGVRRLCFGAMVAAAERTPPAWRRPQSTVDIFSARRFRFLFLLANTARRTADKRSVDRKTCSPWLGAPNGGCFFFFSGALNSPLSVYTYTFWSPAGGYRSKGGTGVSARSRQATFLGVAHLERVLGRMRIVGFCRVHVRRGLELGLGSRRPPISSRFDLNASGRQLTARNFGE